MKHLILTFALALTTLFGFSQENEGITITVTIDNVANNNGKVVMSLHTSETFMKGKGIKSAEANIKDGKATATFENVLSGEYAIIALHDENDNKRMDFRENGMPLESYGMSNNPMSFGPPQYEDAKFKVKDNNLDLNIRF
ncbi:DUF2141 domain-containing protein [Winogradskyella sp.]|jgi:uncharacterized protein (DUF2141 family)|uniref:DUF2141 domain-containing protein n=1 Tax=Winogradskyella sp. TaxID=1883156 RepID=UPI0025FBC642|nr:DUF2141 domain-containing protein [Winogradskyella sp.]MCT4628269.1 DUF2141 domain-containing protein [Winogradskyella sp.]